jgi:hypothetical protein
MLTRKIVAASPSVISGSDMLVVMFTFFRQGLGAFRSALVTSALSTFDPRAFNH